MVQNHLSAFPSNENKWTPHVTNIISPSSLQVPAETLTPPPEQLSTQDKLITQKNLKIPQILFSPPTHKSYLKRWLHDTIEDFPKEIKNV